MSDVFSNPLDASIDEALAEVESLFIPSAILHLSSHRRPSPYTRDDPNPLSVERLSFPNGYDKYCIERNFVKRKCVAYLLVFINPFTHSTLI